MEQATSPPALAPARVHEVWGEGASAFALMRAAERSGPVLWIQGPWRLARLHPQGVARLFDPARLLMVEARRAMEALWCLEEALRGAGDDAAVIAALPEALDLTQSRRLQLAAERGGALGLCLTPETPASNAVETRWRAAPSSHASSCASSCSSTSHRWELVKNKRGILGAWEVCWDDAARSVRVVSPSLG